MLPTDNVKIVLFAAICSVLIGCSAEIPRGDATTQIGSTGEFTREHRRAAAALSIGNQTAATRTTNLVDRLSLCIRALEFLSGRVPQSGGIPRQLDAVKTIYVERLAAQQSARDGTATSDDRVTEPDLTEAELARASLTCLQEAQKMG